MKASRLEYTATVGLILSLLVMLWLINEGSPSPERELEACLALGTLLWVTDLFLRLRKYVGRDSRIPDED